jgi:phosphoenolpyruvate carboxykinase (diphosphate)
MTTAHVTPELARYLDLKLTALGQPTARTASDSLLLETVGPLLRSHHQKDLMLGQYLCPADARIQAFLDAYLQEVCPGGAPRLPGNTFILDRPGLARLMSLPPGEDTFSSPYLRSYRVRQGVLHNPSSDRRTTQGVFHIAEGGLGIPADKLAVPTQTFAALLAAALQPPPEVLALPFTAGQAEQARLFVSLLLRPLVCPATGTDPKKTMEIRFFAPGSLVSNLDFVESIFGSAGDPHLPENDAALDAAHWTGHTGCVIVAPHIVGLGKASLGLPPESEATPRQKRDGMCWRDPHEPYNGGNAFKICCRDRRGVMVTIIADNYYGYCKKEVKTQISFSANLFGLCEEEHAGGAMASAAYVLGQDFYADHTISLKKTSFEEALDILDGMVEPRAGRYAVDTRYPDILYVPENAVFQLREGRVWWTHEGHQHDGHQHELTLRKDTTYVLPSGFRVRLEKRFADKSWRLIGTRPRGTLCHKPCTVSGGGKSEISKSIANALLQGPVFVRDFHADMDQVAEILAKDFSTIFEDRPADARTRRPILSPERSLGSVIQLLTPSPQYTDDYNEWLRQLRQTTRQILFTVKRYYRPEWGDPPEKSWRAHFTVDRINGFLGHELKFDNQKLISNYLRVGYDRDGSWRIYKLRPDFFPADKVQFEDDITASVVLPRESLNDLDPEYANPSVKLVGNCEMLLFQRPDDAIHRGADPQAEADMAGASVFISNYEPISIQQAASMVDHVVEFDRYADPMRGLIEDFVRNVEGGPSYVVSSAHPRIVDGQPSKNPRYLQKRPDLATPRESYLTEIAARLERGIPAARPVHFPVNAVLSGRRNNPPDLKTGQPPLAVYNPIHYQELPELFMEFISSLTGKSPSTIGFGSEGALTKGPFNALWPVVDLNNALVSAILTQYAGFTTSAGYIGPDIRVDHDVSLLVPEIWCRMRVAERDPRFLIEHGFLEKVADVAIDGRTVLASRLGYRITSLFVDHFLGRIFETPSSVFTSEMLWPEEQGLALYAAGVDAIVETQRRVALNYFEDGSVEAACPPLKALLHILVHGNYEGLGIDAPEFRALFGRETMLASNWYRERLQVKQDRDIALWQRHAAALEAFRLGPGNVAGACIDLQERFELVRRELARVSSPAYLEKLRGTIGADPFHCQAVVGQVPGCHFAE